MTPEKVLQVIEDYRKYFTERGIAKIDYPHDKYVTESWTLEHCHGMLDRMVIFVQEGKMEKAFRWLGFIQGVLWSSRVYTLNELRNHNRST